MFANLILIHKISVYSFMLLYLFKLIGLLANSDSLKAFFAKKLLRIFEMVVSTAFLITGVWMYVELPEKSLFLHIKIMLVLLSIPIAIIGFKKGRKLLALLSYLMLIAAFGLAEMNRMKPKIAKNIAANTSGADLFTAAGCVTCHGTDGKSSTVGAKDLSISNLSDDVIISTIKNGKNAMPSFKKVLKENEIQGLAEYVKTLRK